MFGDLEWGARGWLNRSEACLEAERRAGASADFAPFAELARRFLKHYPPDRFPDAGGEPTGDPGAVFVVRLRRALLELERTAVL